MTVHSEGVHLKELGIGESQKITQQSKASKSGANLLTLKVKRREQCWNLEAESCKKMS